MSQLLACICRLKASLQRVQRLTQGFTDGLLSLFPTRADALGAALGIQPERIQVCICVKSSLSSTGYGSSGSSPQACVRTQAEPNAAQTACCACSTLVLTRLVRHPASSRSASGCAAAACGIVVRSSDPRAIALIALGYQCRPASECSGANALTDGLLSLFPARADAHGARHPARAHPGVQLSGCTLL